VRKLRHGYTTGACAAAAAKGAAIMLRDRKPVSEVEILLPGGEPVRFALHGQEVGPAAASCFVVKDAGDDPDVTNGAAIHATVSLGGEPSAGPEGRIVIEGGEGVGRVTKPGLAVAVGEWAINPVPRRMIREGIEAVFAPSPAAALTCRISIPGGEELARRTLNGRLGILGGLSILGTTGIVRPVSAQAWTDTIDAAIDVALAAGSGTVVLSTGRTSELTAQRHLRSRPGPVLKDEAFVMMGDHVGHAVESCSRKGVAEIILSAQFAKLLKIGCGHRQTHVASSRLDLGRLAGWLAAEGGDETAGSLLQANSARQILESSGAGRERLVALVAEKAAAAARPLAGGCRIKVLVAGYHGEVLYFA
jgi:cobalt-precorrin-5B (C1)-methyltransferase